MDGATVRLATRASPLARWQSDHVAGRLRAVRPDWSVEVVEVSTEGDRRHDVPLAQLGGKGVFVKEVQAAVLDGSADLAVHSAKDLPALTPTGLVVTVVGERADPRDALVGARLADLPPEGVVATGSQRRAVQLVDARPDLVVVDLRGNMATRLARAAAPGVDAVVVAAAALERLGRLDEAAELLEPEVMLPQVGQGVIAAECRADAAELRAALVELDHPPTHRRWRAERAFLEELGGDCDLPAGAYAEVDGHEIRVRGLLAVDGAIRRDQQLGSDPATVGRSVARSVRRG